MDRYIPITIKLEKIRSAKLIIGIFLSLAILLACIIWPVEKNWMMKLTWLLIAVLPVAALVRISAKTDWAAVFLNILWGIGCVSIVVLAGVRLYFDPDAMFKIGLNILCAFFVVAVFLACTASWKLSINLTASLIFLLLLVNNIVFSFRGKELGINDFLSVRTALSVAGQYTFQVTTRFIYLCAAAGFGIFSQFAIPPFPKGRIRKMPVRIVSLIAAVAVAATIGKATANIPVKTWEDEGTILNGYLLNFYLGIRSSSVMKPEGYTPETVEEFAQGYHENDVITGNAEKPNIIVIMNESFVDLSIFENPPATNIPVTPYIDSLSDNVIKGYSLCSVYGGNTANSEFEFLTGHTMGFLPDGTVPYQQYIFDPIGSLAWTLESLGYTSFATHPYHAKGWSRYVVYPRLGLEDYTFLEDYPSQNMVRDYVSDQEMFEYIMAYLREKQAGQPLFLMGITMQNHGGYLYEGDNYTQTVHLEGMDGQYPFAEQYLSLIHETDRAVEYLLTELQEYPEDTLVLFFGDHFPRLEDAFYEELNGGAFDTLDKQMLKYTVPFFIWANYDMEPQYIPLTSLNYLSHYVMEYAQVQLPTYYRILADIEKTLPALNAFGYYSVEENRFLPFEKAAGKEAEALDMYRLLQYNNLFDPKNRNEELYAQYLK